MLVAVKPVIPVIVLHGVKEHVEFQVINESREDRLKECPRSE